MVIDQISTIQQNGYSTLGCLYRGPGPGGPILRREGLLMLLKKSTKCPCRIVCNPTVIYYEGQLVHHTPTMDPTLDPMDLALF